MSDSVITIDLTDSLCLINHNALSDLIIEIDDADEPITCAARYNTPKRNLTDHGPRKLIKKKEKKKIPTTPDAILGQCSICCERLGKRQIASTICGHVFCMSCIELAYRHDRRCPQCRKKLNRQNKYHAIYLPLTIE